MKISDERYILLGIGFLQISTVLVILSKQSFVSKEELSEGGWFRV